MKGDTQSHALVSIKDLLAAAPHSRLEGPESPSRTNFQRNTTCSPAKDGELSKARLVISSLLPSSPRSPYLSSQGFYSLISVVKG